MKPSELYKQIVDVDSKDKSGIYMIYNVKTDKAYIGHSESIYRRWIDHKSSLRLNCHKNSHLQHSYNLHGPNCFIYVVLEQYPYIDKLAEKENSWLEKIDKECRYNLVAVVPNGPMSDETKEKISQANRRRGPLKEETKKKLSEILKTRVFTPEHRAKISAAKKGKSTGKQSDETKRKRSEALTGRKRPPRSEEWCRKLSEGRKRNNKLQESTLENDL